jgi:hypothetical protein
MSAPHRGQRSDHDGLLRHLELRPGAAPAGRPIDAIIVPASRRAHHLLSVVDLAASYGTTLVVLASHRCRIEEAAELVARTPGSGRAVLAEIPDGSELLECSPATSGEDLRPLNGYRSSNLSLKRNLGLLLARQLGWQKIMFMDDDIFRIGPADIARVAHHLDTNRYAGLKTVFYPDNSVVCHANREYGASQGIFVSGAALGVRTAEDVARLDVFPDVYNEDWFALADEAGRKGVAHVGDVDQIEFNPFDDPKRAVQQEFGDLLAEGLYALFNDGLGRRRATRSYWEHFIGERRRLIERLRKWFEEDDAPWRQQGSKCLQEALFQLDDIRPEDCIAFLDAWQEDQHRFVRLSSPPPTLRSGYREAFADLGITRWQEARFGIARMQESPGYQAAESPPVNRSRSSTRPKSSSSCR